MKKIFLFDLDSTITKEEILPSISKSINKEDEMRKLTEMTMMGEISFEESFKSRVDMLKDIPVSEVAEKISNISLNQELVKFLNKHKDICYIVTGNLDVWIDKLMKKIGMENNYFCSKALVSNNKITKISKILQKDEVVAKFKDYIVAIGDGSNDYKLLEKANLGVAFGGVRNIAPSLLEVCDYAIYDEKRLAEFLERLIEE